MHHDNKKIKFSYLIPFSFRDLSITCSILLCAVGLCILLQQQAYLNDGFAAPVFVLAVLLVSRFTNGYLFGMIASLLGVVCVNFIFTYPYWEVNFSISGYPLTFIVFLVVSIMTSALTIRVRQQERLRTESEKEKIRADLLRSVSHDIRTPLTSIMGAASAMLENSELPLSDRQELLEDIRNESQWLIRVVENLLSITRMGNAKAHITKEAEAAEEVLGEVVRKFRRHFSHITVSVTVPNELLMVPMDAILIEQVLSNLLENAVIHGGSTTNIRLSVYKEENCARFTVADDGQGIAKDKMPILFSGTIKHGEAFNGDGKRNMGLGLSVCLAIIRAHGGTMGAKNLERGAEFFFCLPLSEEEAS